MEKDETNQALRFGPYEITGANGQVLQRNRPLALSPKAVAVLWTLVHRPGQVVSKEELFTAIWPETIVSEGVLTSRIREVRQALGDTTATPRYIETVSRRGYRFIEKVVQRQPAGGKREAESRNSPFTEHKAPSFSPQAADLGTPPSVLVGREAELTQLHSLFAKAGTGERQVVFVTGEAGIGKTALVAAFLQRLGPGVQRQGDDPPRAPSREPGALRSPSSHTVSAERSALCVAYGQCIEHYGAGEAYLPLLEAVSGLCRQADGAQVLDVLRRVAPTWLGQLPAVLTEADYAALQPKVAGATRERMLREMVEALEMLSAERILVLVLEDVHWSDASTTDLLNLVARRRERARLLVVATYRPAEVIVSEHPLKRVKQELVTRGQGVEIVVGGLGMESVQRYVQQRWAAGARNPATAAVVYRRTEGHPLFMVQLVDYLVQQEPEAWRAERVEVVERLIPQQLRQLLEVQVEQLTAEEQQVLEVGSVAGAEFTVASVGAGMGGTEEEIEAVCERLAQRGQFIAERTLETWPDGTVSGRYGFRHALYQEVLYQRLSGSRRARLHRQIGERLESGYGERVSEVAAELAMHFERGRDYERTVRYLHAAGENALRRSAYHEAHSHVTTALALLKTLPESAEHRQRELLLRLALAPVLGAIHGTAAGEVELAYARAQTLAQQTGDFVRQFSALRGLWRSSWMHGQLPLARRRAEQLLELARQGHTPWLFHGAHLALGCTLYFLGELPLAKAHLEQALACVDPCPGSAEKFGYGEVFGLVQAYLAFSLWQLGYADQARQHTAEAQARQAGGGYDVAAVRMYAMNLQHLLQERQAVHTQSQQLIQMATAQGFPQWVALGRLFEGWGLTGQGEGGQGIVQIRQGLAAFQASGARLALTYFFGLLIDAHRMQGQWREGLGVVADALAVGEQTGERFYEAELYRLKGELTLQQLKMKNVELKITRAKGEKSRQSSVLTWQSPTPSTQAEAEEYFLKAIDIARHQHAKSLELRAVMSLARLRQCQTTPPAPRTALAEAHQMLSEVYHWFTEGFDTQDLQEARTLLEELS